MDANGGDSAAVRNESRAASRPSTSLENDLFESGTDIIGNSEELEKWMASFAPDDDQKKPSDASAKPAPPAPSSATDAPPVSTITTPPPDLLNGKRLASQFVNQSCGLCCVCVAFLHSYINLIFYSRSATTTTSCYAKAPASAHQL